MCVDHRKNFCIDKGGIRVGIYAVMYGGTVEPLAMNEYDILIYLLILRQVQHQISQPNRYGFV